MMRFSHALKIILPWVLSIPPVLGKGTYSGNEVDLRQAIDEAQVLPVNEDLLSRKSSKASFILPCSQCLGQKSGDDGLVFTIETKDTSRDTTSTYLQELDINPQKSHDNQIFEVQALIYNSTDDSSVGYTPSSGEMVLKAQKDQIKRKFKVRSLDVNSRRKIRNEYDSNPVKVVYFKVNDYYDKMSQKYVPIVGSEVGLFDVSFWKTTTGKWYIQEITTSRKRGYDLSQNLLLDEWERSHRILETNKFWRQNGGFRTWFTMKCPECFRNINSPKDDSLLLFELVNHGESKHWAWYTVDYESGNRSAARKTEGIPFGINYTQISTIAQSVPGDYDVNARIFNYGAPFKYHNITFKYESRKTFLDRAIIPAQDQSFFSEGNHEFFAQTVWLQSIDGKPIKNAKSSCAEPGFEIIYYHEWEDKGAQPVMVVLFGEAYPAVNSHTFLHSPTISSENRTVSFWSILASNALPLIVLSIAALTLFKFSQLLRFVLRWTWRRLRGDAAEEDYWALNDDDVDSDGDGYTEDSSEKMMLDHFVAVDDETGRKFKMVRDSAMEMRPRSRKNTTRQFR